LEERILRVVATAQIERNRLSVRDLIGKSELGSSATLCNRLTSLREKGWLQLSDTEVARRKQVELTEAALLYLDDVAYRIPEAVKWI
jgi:hypothetical protein